MSVRFKGKRGNIHIVVLCNFDELCDLAGITDYLNLKE
jgi:hypothetical protein